MRQAACRVGFGTWALAVQLRLKPLARPKASAQVDRHLLGIEGDTRRLGDGLFGSKQLGSTRPFRRTWPWPEFVDAEAT